MNPAFLIAATPDPFGILIPAAVGLVVAGAGYWANRKLGIAPAQQALVKTLQDTVDAMKDNVEVMTTEFQGCKVRLVAVEAHNEELKQDLFQLRLKISKSKKTKKTVGEA